MISTHNTSCVLGIFFFYTKIKKMNQSDESLAGFLHFSKYSFYYILGMIALIIVLVYYYIQTVLLQQLVATKTVQEKDAAQRSLEKWKANRIGIILMVLGIAAYGIWHFMQSRA